MTTSIRYEKQDNGNVHLVFDAPGPANVMDSTFSADFIEIAGKLAAESDLKGVILRSAKSMFFAGGDLDSLIQVTPDDAPEFFAGVERLKAAMRQVETLGKPVVACINGPALGGGWERSGTRAFISPETQQLMQDRTDWGDLMKVSYPATVNERKSESADSSQSDTQD